MKTIDYKELSEIIGITIDDLSDALMLITSNLSDVQQMIEYGEFNEAVIRLNGIKTIVSKLRKIEK